MLRYWPRESYPQAVSRLGNVVWQSIGVTISKFRCVDLSGEVFRDAVVMRFLAADVLASGAEPLATVYYAGNGKKQRYGLRLDMDKRVFLDRFENDRNAIGS
jgi:hypothetical protein